MDLEQARLKLKCEHCKNDIILTFHTQRCPKCGFRFDPNEVKQIFYDYESQVENSKATQVGNALDGCGTALQGCGQAIGNLGCLIMIILILILLLHFIFSLM
ncbi:hypothetical protein [Streptococcus rubneri]|uniref:hypothetical protein n=1 Tax=Streptococcus rubneri TaxID=1234680 RepID=UPI0032194BFD